jgi:hypothetical protein
MVWKYTIITDNQNPFYFQYRSIQFPFYDILWIFNFFSSANFQNLSDRYDFHTKRPFVTVNYVFWVNFVLTHIKETMSTTMHLFTFYLESDGMSTNNDYKQFFGALSLQFC